MWTERLHLEHEPIEQSPAGFVAMPMVLFGLANAMGLQQQLYALAFEQARRAMVERQRFGPRDLFAIMN